MSDMRVEPAETMVAQAAAPQSTGPIAPEIDLSTAPTTTEWVARLDELGDELDPDHGGFTPLGAHHAALYHDAGDTLVVSFEWLDTIRKRQPDHRPKGFTLASAQGWSSLSLVATAPRWFRDQEIIDFFDAQIDSSFFDGFRRILFFGEGMAGYAACAYSVAAPGATVLAIAPQATLDPRIAGWDTRFRAARRLDFSSRFGFAPDMLDGSRNAFILHDPARRLDLMHATLFRRDFTTLLRTPNLGGPTAAALEALGLLEPLMIAAAEGRLSGALLARLLRARRSDAQYLAHLTRRCAKSGRTRFTAIAAQRALEAADRRKAV